MRIGFRALAIAVAVGGLVATCLAQQISKITIKGNVQVSDAFVSSNVRLKVGQSPTEAELRKEEDNLLGLGVFKTVKVQLVPEGTATTLLVEVSEYPVVKEVRVVGNQEVKTDVITTAVLAQQKLGAVWNARAADRISQAIREIYQQHSMQVDFTQIGPQAESPNTLTISILEPKIGKIELIGLKATKPETIKRLLHVHPGGPYRDDVLAKDFETLKYGTGWFKDVKGERKPGDTAGDVDVKFTFTEDSTRQFNAGLALDPQSHLVGTVDIGETNFKGLGQSLGLNLSQATTGGGPSASFSFGNRFYDSQNTTMNMRLFSTVVYNFTGSGFSVIGNSSNNAYDERRSGFALSFVRPYGDLDSVTLGLTARRAQTVDVNTGTINFIQQDGDLASIQLGGIHSTIRGGNEPYRGNAFSFGIEPGYSNITKLGGGLAGQPGLIGSNFFAKFTGEYKTYFSKDPKKKKDQSATDLDFEPRPVIAFRTKVGAISGTVPFFEQLFVGGTDSLRGYDNQRFWGSKSFLSTLEYRQPLQKSFMMALFADYGGAWDGYGVLNGFAQTSNPQFHGAYGLGFGFKVDKLGAIRIDFALNSEGGSRTHFSFGSSF